MTHVQYISKCEVGNTEWCRRNAKTSCFMCAYLYLKREFVRFYAGHFIGGRADVIIWGGECAPTGFNLRQLASRSAVTHRPNADSNRLAALPKRGSEKRTDWKVQN